MKKNYLLREGNIGAIIGFLTYLVLWFVYPFSNSVRNFVENIFFVGIINKFLESNFTIVFDTIYNSDTWIILFPLAVMTLVGFIYGIILSGVYKKIKMKGGAKI